MSAVFYTVQPVRHKSRSRHWMNGVAAAGRGDSPTSKPLIELLMTVLKEQPALAPGSANDDFHRCQSATTAAAIDKLRASLACERHTSRQIPLVSLVTWKDTALTTSTQHQCSGASYHCGRQNARWILPVLIFIIRRQPPVNFPEHLFFEILTIAKDKTPANFSQ